MSPNGTSSDGRTGAVVRLYDLHGRELLRIAYLLTSDRAITEDLVQETFVRAWRSWGQLRNPDAAPAWLRATLVNQARRSLRRRLHDWRLLATGPPDPLPGHSTVAVWTGQELLVWGGDRDGVITSQVEGAAYDPARDAWRRLPPAPAAMGDELVLEQAAFWDGSRMIAVAATDGMCRSAAYDPATDTWRQLADCGPLPPYPVWGELTAARAGGATLVVAEPGDDWAYTEGSRPVLAAYDLATGRWRSPAALPDGVAAGAAPVWTGRELVLVGLAPLGSDEDGLERTAAAAYDPAADRWGALPEPPRPLSIGVAGVWAGGEALFVGGRVEPVGPDAEVTGNARLVMEAVAYRPGG